MRPAAHWPHKIGKDRSGPHVDRVDPHKADDDLNAGLAKLVMVPQVGALLPSTRAARVPGETAPRARCPFRAVAQRKFSFPATAVKTQGVLRGCLSVSAAAGHRVASGDETTRLTLDHMRAQRYAATG
jgi:hypothetical protein